MSEAEVQVLIIVGICALGLILVAVLVALLLRNRSSNIGPKHRRRDIYASGGADLETGQIIADDNYFRGMSGENLETVLVLDGLRCAVPTVTLRDTSGYLCNVSLSTPLTIGRESGRGYFTVRDPAASRVHAIVFANGDRVYIQDNNSSNHTYLNGKMLDGVVECKNGDVIRVGKTNIQVSIR